jgi:hypothetical protein
VNSVLSVCGLAVRDLFFINADTCKLSFQHLSVPASVGGCLVLEGSAEVVVEQYFFLGVYGQYRGCDGEA